MKKNACLRSFFHAAAPEFKVGLFFSEKGKGFVAVFKTSIFTAKSIMIGTYFNRIIRILIIRTKTGQCALDIRHLKINTIELNNKVLKC